MMRCDKQSNEVVTYQSNPIWSGVWFKLKRCSVLLVCQFAPAPCVSTAMATGLAGTRILPYRAVARDGYVGSQSTALQLP